MEVDSATSVCRDSSWHKQHRQLSRYRRKNSKNNKGVILRKTVIKLS